MLNEKQKSIKDISMFLNESNYVKQETKKFFLLLIHNVNFNAYTYVSICTDKTLVDGYQIKLKNKMDDSIAILEKDDATKTIFKKNPRSEIRVYSMQVLCEDYNNFITMIKEFEDKGLEIVDKNISTILRPNIFTKSMMSIVGNISMILNKIKPLDVFNQNISKDGTNDAGSRGTDGIWWRYEYSGEFRNYKPDKIRTSGV